MLLGGNTVEGPSPSPNASKILLESPNVDILINFVTEVEVPKVKSPATNDEHCAVSSLYILSL